MIQSFGDKTTEDIFDGINSRYARQIPKELHRKAHIQLAKMNLARQLSDLKQPPSNRLESLKGELASFYSIRINEQWRIIFKWNQGHTEAVQIVDYH